MWLSEYPSEHFGEYELFLLTEGDWVIDAQRAYFQHPGGPLMFFTLAINRIPYLHRATPCCWAEVWRRGEETYCDECGVPVLYAQTDAVKFSYHRDDVIEWLTEWLALDLGPLEAIPEAVRLYDFLAEVSDLFQDLLVR